MSDQQRADLAAAVEGLAADAARQTLGFDPSHSDVDQRERWLATLSSLLAIRDSAEQLAASAALSAAEHGADYPAIGEAAGMTRQGARRKWPGLAGLADAHHRKQDWWNRRGSEFVACARAVVDLLAGHQDSPWLANLRAQLDAPDQLDMMIIDAHAVAMNATVHDHAVGLLAALTADAYAATNSHAALTIGDARSCGHAACTSEPVIGLMRAGQDPTPACHQHAVEALRQPGTRIVTAFQPDVALEVFAEARRP